MSWTSNISCSVNSFFFLPIVPMEVYREIHNLNSKKVEGPEGIPVQFYKDANKCISVFLCELFNACVQIGFFPSALKLAKVIPIYKGEDHCSPNNYRPISLLSPISKIFEILISKPVVLKLVGSIEPNRCHASIHRTLNYNQERIQKILEGGSSFELG